MRCYSSPEKLNTFSPVERVVNLLRFRVVSLTGISTSCALKGICVVDEVEVSLADNNCGSCGGSYGDDHHHKWRGHGNGHDEHRYGDYRDGEDNDEDDDDDDDDYDDGSSCSTNCGISVKFPTLFVKQKESCNLSVATSCNTPEQLGSVVGLSSTLSVTAYTGNTTGVNSDGNFTTGSSSGCGSGGYAKRLIVGYDYKGRPAAWEVGSNCEIRSIRQGKYSNQAQLPLGNSCTTYRFTVTGVDANGQYIYGTRKQISNNQVVNIRWRVTEYYQRVWVLSYEIVTGGIGKSEGDILETTTDLSDKVDATVYPNPSQDAFNVRVDSHNDALIDVLVMDEFGREVVQLNNQNPGFPVVLTDDMIPSAGVYFVSVKQGNFNKILKITKLN